MGTGDLNSLKQLPAVGTATANTFVTFNNTLLTDNALNEVIPLSAANALQATAVILDTTSPTVQEFDLNMANYRLTLRLSEPANTSTLNFTGLRLQEQRSSTNTDLQVDLTGGEIISARFSTEVQIQLTFVDVVSLQLARALATNGSNVVLVVRGGTFLDMSEQAVTAVTTDNALSPTSFVADNVRPRLTNFTLNMDNISLVLTFSEVISIASFKYDQLTLQGDQQRSGATQVFTLENCTHTSTDAFVIVISLSRSDANQIKTLSALGTSVGDSYLSILDSAGNDTAANRINGTTGNVGFPVGIFVADTTDAILTEFALNMSNGDLTLWFTETMNASTVNVSGFILMSARGGQAATYQLQDATVSPFNSATILLRLGTDDLNAIKTIPSIATTDSNIFLAVRSTAVEDMAGNAVTEINATQALDATGFVEDSVEAAISRIDLDIDAGTLTFSFTEAMNASSLNISTITIQNTAASSSQNYTLTNVSRTNSSDGTTIVIDIGTSDLDKIKALSELATVPSSRDAFVDLIASTILDMQGNSITGLDGNALEVDSFQQDATRPSFSGFNFNLNTRLVTLTFSETVNTSSFDSEGIRFQNTVNVTSDTVFHRLQTGATIVRQALNVLTFQISSYDANQIKAASQLGTATNTTYIALRSTTITDMLGLAVNAVRTDAAVEAADFTPDDTDPRLLRFSALMNRDVSNQPGKPYLLLTFEEAVNETTVNTSAIILQQNESNGLRLTGGNVSRYSVGGSTNMSHIIKVDFTNDDLLAIRSLASVARTNLTTFMAVDSTLVRDFNGNAVGSINRSSAIQVSEHTIDVTPPVLLTFNLNLQTNRLELIFNENVTVSTLQISNITLQSTRTNATVSYRLTDSTLASTMDGTTVIVSISTNDIDNIKGDPNLALDENSTFFSAPANFIRDPAFNYAVGIGNTSAVQVSSYTQDGTQPEVVSFNLNMTTGVVDVTFDEVVNVSSTDISKFRLSNADSNSAQVSNPLAGIVTSSDGLVLSFTMSLASANEVRANVELAVSSTSTFLVVADGAITDVDGNGVLPSTTNVTTYAADTEVAIAEGFALNLNAGFLTILYNQPVNGSTLVPTAFTLQNNATNPSANHSIAAGVVVAGVYSTNITFRLSADDVNVLKRKSICTISNGTDCYVTFGNNSVRDAAGLTVTRITTGVPVVALTPDQNAPAILDNRPVLPSIDLNTGEITIEFNETIDRTSFDVSKLVIASDSSDAFNGITYVNVSAARVTNEVDNTTIVIELSNGDLNAIKANTGLCRRRTDCYIKAGAGMFKDHAGNALIPTGELHQSIYVFLPDTTRPNLLNFSLNMNESIVTLTFDETVDISTLTRSGITIQSAANSSVAVTLETCTEGDGGCTSTDADGPVVTIALTSTDLSRIKLAEFGTSVADSFLRLDNNTIKDMGYPNQNAVVSISNGNAIQVQADGYIADTRNPRVSGFSFNLENSRITVTFSEPITPSQTNISKITLFAARNASSASKRLSSDGYVTDQTTSSLTATIQLAEEDETAIKSTPGFFTSTGDSFIAVDADLARDKVNLSTVAITVANALQADAFSRDDLRGQLISFTYDLSLRQINLEFNEIMDTDTFRATEFVIQSLNITQISYAYRLTDSTFTGPDGFNITINLSADDYLALGEEGRLATNINDTYLTMTANAADDVLGRDVLAVTQVAGMKAARFIIDETPPAIAAYSVNLSAATLTLNFTEQINATSFVATNRITLQNVANGSTGTVQNRTIVGTSSEVSSDRTQATVFLESGDLNAIKLLQRLATSLNDTFLVYTSTICSDLSGNPPEAVTRFAALQVGQFTSDSVPPDLVAFYLNMHTANLTLSMSEVVQVGTTDVTQITLQSSRANEVNFTLTEGEVLTSENGLVLTVQLGIRDLNVIKQRPLATDSADTFLRISSNFVKDMANNSVNAIAPGAAITVTDFVPDASDPVLVGANLNMNNATLVLVFNETIKATSVNATRFTIQNASNTANMSVQLTSTDVVGSDATTISLRLSRDDMNSLKARPNLATSNLSSFVSVVAGGAFDMSELENPLVPVSSQTAIQVGNFVADETSPTLTSYSVNFDSGLVVMSFDEVVNPSTLNASTITFSASNTSQNPQSHRVTSVLQVSSQLAPTVSFTLSSDDVTDIKFLAELCVNSSTTFISIETATIRDMSDNNVNNESLFPISPDDYTPDTTAPAVVSFSLDIDGAVLNITLDEPVSEQINLTRITISRNNTGAQEDAYTLTSSSTVTLANSDLLVSIALSSIDLNSMKALPNTAVSNSSTVLSMLPGAIHDRAQPANPNLELYAANNTRADQFIEDQTNVTVQAFEFNLNNGSLSLTFSETVNASSFDASKITFQSEAGSGGVSVSLTGYATNSLSRGRFTVITMTLLASDLDAIKALATLAVDSNSTLLSATAGLISDMVGLPSEPIPVADPLQTTNFTADTTNPAMVRFSLDMDDSVLSITFSQTVNATSLDPTRIALFNGNDVVVLTVDDVGVYNAAFPTVMNISLSGSTANQLKVLETVATSVNTTYLTVNTSSINDMAGNPNDITTAKATSFIADTTAPVFQNFSVDLSTGTVELSFDEIVRGLSVNRSSLRLESNSSASNTSVLLLINHTVDVNSTVLNLTIATSALNTLKIDAALATSTSNAYIYSYDDAVLDMNTNGLSGIASNAPLQAQNFIEDLVKPTLVSWDINVNDGTVTFSFDESVNASSMNFTKITIFSDSN